jgi:ketosteroid isomerase-like protein
MPNVRQYDGTDGVASVMAMPSLVDDRDAIRDLMARYNHAIDGGEAEEWAALFTADALFDTGQRFSGTDELLAFAQGVASSGRRTRHVVANAVIEVDGDRATCQAYLLLYAGSPPQLALTGAYEDELVRVGGSWRYSRRTFIPDG